MEMKWLPLWVAALLLTSIANAENLHREYGPTWECSLISDKAPYKGLCLQCELDGLDFDRQGDGGRCVPKGQTKTPEASPKSAPLRQAEPIPQEDGHITKMDTPPGWKSSQGLGDPDIPTPEGKGWITKMDPPPRTAETAKAWHAVAWGLKDPHVSAGYGKAPTRNGAEDSALRECNASRGNVACRVVFSHWSGCQYVVVGKGKSGVTAGRGDTQEAALGHCRKGGNTCQQSKVIGGCLDE